MGRFGSVVLALGTAGLVWATPVSASECTQPPEFFGLGDLPGGPFDSGASAVTPDGQVVVGLSRSSSGFPGWEAFRWTSEEGMVGLGFLPGDEHSRAIGVSADGTVIVGDSGIDNSVHQAVRWENGTPTGLGSLPGHEPPRSTAVAVSSDGSVVAGTSSTNEGTGAVESFRWTQATGLVGLGGSRISIAEDMSAAGDVIVGWEWFPLAPSPCFQHAFRWESDVVENFGDCDNYAGAISISGDGRVIYGQTIVDGTFELMRVADGIISTEGFIPGHTQIFARGVDTDGGAVVGQTEEPGGLPERAFLWDEENGLRLLQDALVGEYGLGDELAGWTLHEGADITDGCRVVVGRGTNPAGDSEAFYAVLPEPGGLAGWLAGAAWLAVLRRRR